MPNFIKNRLEIKASKEEIQLVLEKFSTKHEKKPRVSYDGSLLYKNKDTNEVGWLKDGVFTTGDNTKKDYVPLGFEQKFEKEWIQFPDFNKIIEMPKDLDIDCDSNLMLFDSFNDEGFKKKLDNIKKELGDNKLLNDKTIENFTQGIKNYLNYGHATWYTWSKANWGTKWNSSSCEKISENTFEFDTAWNGVVNLIQKMSEEFPSIEFVYEYSDENIGENCCIVTFINGIKEVKELENGSNEAFELAFKLRPYCKEEYKIIDGEYKYIDEE